MSEKTEEQIREEIQLEIEKEKARARVETETREVSTIMQDTSKTIASKLNSRAADIINQSPEIDKKIEETTHTLVDMGLETQKNQVETELKKSQKDKSKAEFELDEDQYRAFGQNTSPKETWKKRIISLGYNFWFCVMWAVCLASLAPFYVFMKIIEVQKGVLKVVAIIVGVALLLGCLGGLTYGVIKWSGAIG